jgi:hypothetical protein
MQTQAVTTPLVCGPGTHVEGETCVADAPVPGYQVRALSHISADGATPVTIVAFGTNSDGSYATDPIVFNTDRAGAGSFANPVATLDARGASAVFTPCNASVAGCTGSVGFTIARSSAPTVPIAQITAELDAPPLIGSIEQCSGTEDVLYLEGAGFAYTGKLTVRDATFAMTGGDAHAVITVMPANAIQGLPWTLLFDSVQMNTTLAPGVFQQAISAPVLGKPELGFTSASPYSHCDFSTQGEFQIFDYQATSHITASFRVWCDPQTVLSGCLHVH